MLRCSDSTDSSYSLFPSNSTGRNAQEAERSEIRNEQDGRDRQSRPIKHAPCSIKIHSTGPVTKKADECEMQDSVCVTWAAPPELRKKNKQMNGSNTRVSYEIKKHRLSMQIWVSTNASFHHDPVR